MSEPSVSLWLDQLKAGNPDAARPLWDRYFGKLVGLARGKLSARVRRAADEEDVALSAFHSFCRAVDEGRLPQLDDRDDLWAVLVTLTERKAFALADRETAAKRGGGRMRGDSIFGPAGGAGADVPAPDPTPAFAAEVAETCERLLTRVADRDPVLRDIAVWKLEGHTNEELAIRAGKSVATIERKLALIRTLWSEEVLS